jgi:CheY-like chemotaxis protein
VSKRILLIDSDEAFAQGLSSAINARGFVATMATNSEQGMSLAKQQNPDLIVVCVEAQPTNGYMLCTRLKKDEALKGIPVILTSAHATADSFEKHKKLKTRAEEYLIKPFEPRAMLEKASALMGVSLPPEQLEDEIVAVEDEPLGLGDLIEGEDEPISLSESDAAEAHGGQPEEALVVEEVEEVEVQEEQPQGDEDLAMFDKAFDSLGAPAPQTDQTRRFSAARAQKPAAAASEEEEEHQPTELTAPDDDAVLNTLEEPSLGAGLSELPDDDDLRSQLDSRVAELQQRLAERDAELEQARKGETSSGAIQRLKEAKNRADKELLRLKEELNAKEKELVELQEQQTALEGQAQQLKDAAVKREAAAKALQQRADALAAAAKKFERELTAARDEAKKAEGLRSKASEVDRLQKELETLRHEMEGAKDMLAEERDELKKQLEEAQVTAVQNEDRAVKAYQKIKKDEQLREKTRKALQIALRLLEENAAAEDSDEAEIKSA